MTRYVSVTLSAPISPTMSDVAISAPVATLRPVASRRIWLSSAMLLVFVMAIPNIRYPIARDQATYCVIGQGLLDGGQLYRDFWDNKPPGIFYAFALVVKLCGTAMWSVGFVDILWLLAISYFIFRFAERYLGTGAAVVAVLFHASWHVQAGYWDAAQAETFLVLFVLGSFFLVVHEGRGLRLRQFAAGVLLGAAFWMKYNAVGLFPLVFVLPYLDTPQLDAKPPRLFFLIPWRGWLRNAVWLVAGFVTMVAGVLLVFRLNGAWHALKEVQFEVLPRYAIMPAQRVPGYGRWALYHTQFYLGFWTECATLVALVIAWKRRELARLAPVLLAAAMGYVVLASQIRYPSFAFATCYPFFAMVWGYLGVTVYRGVRAAAQACARRGWRLARILLWVAFVNVLVRPLPDEIARNVEAYKELGEWRRNPDGFYSLYPWANPISHMHDQMRLIDYLRRTAAPGEGVFVWGSEPLIYFLTRQRAPTRFVSNLGLVSPWCPPAWREELVADLKKSPPRFIVVARDDRVYYISYTRRDSEQYLEVFPELSNFIGANYVRDRGYEGFVVYRRGF